MRDDDDRRDWFRVFQRVAMRCGWRVFAHVLMTNHFHGVLLGSKQFVASHRLLIEDAEADVSDWPARARSTWL